MPTPPAPPGWHPTDPVVVLDEVRHAFGDTLALDDLSFTVPDGRITVLLGPNGAGKTTAFRAITGALVPDAGTVRTFDLDPDAAGHHVRPRCGVVSAKPALYDRLTGRENLIYSGELYGVGATLATRVVEAARRFAIDEALDHAVGGYSTGMKTRLALARSVLHDPELLLFDEPTSGLDPESSHAVLELIRDLTDEGRTVVMCTHLLAEAEGLADHVVMMEGGRALVAGSPDELTARYWPHPIVRLDAEDPRLLDRVAAWSGVLAYRREPAGARLEMATLDALPDLVASLCADGVRLTRVDPHVPTLEDLYFTIRRSDGTRREPAGAVDVATDRDDQRRAPLAPMQQRWGAPARVPPQRSAASTPPTGTEQEALR